MLAVAVVIAGLDPAIHPVRKKVLAKRMDPRVRPAGDGSLAWRETPPLTRLALSALATLSPQNCGEREETGFAACADFISHEFGLAEIACIDPSSPARRVAMALHTT